MSTQYQETKKPRILIIGSTGRIGSRVLAEIAKVDALEAVYSSRRLEQVDAWHKDGKDAVFLDLDRPETFREALTGINRLCCCNGLHRRHGASEQDDRGRCGRCRRQLHRPSGHIRKWA